MMLPFSSAAGLVLPLHLQVFLSAGHYEFKIALVILMHLPNSGSADYPHALLIPSIQSKGPSFTHTVD